MRLFKHAILLFPLLNLHAATFNVPADGTLQNVMRAAANGDTILVAPGSYTATTTPEDPANPIFNVDKSLTIRSTGGSGVTTLNVPSWFTVVRIGANNTTLQGFALTGGGWGVQVFDYRTGGIVNNVTLRDIVVTPNLSVADRGAAIYFYKATNGTVDNCRINNAATWGIFAFNGSNGLRVTGGTTVALAANDGIFVDASNNPTIDGVFIGTSTASGVLGNGIYLRNVSSAVIKAADIRRAGIHGIVLENTQNSVVQTSTIEMAGANGIYLDNGSNNNLVMNNLVAQNTKQYHGIALKNSDYNTVTGNTVQTGFHGIILVGSQFNRIEKNSISGHDYDGITVTHDNLSPSQRRSSNNYLGKNIVNSTGRQRFQQGLVQDGTGIWLNSEANGTFAFGNISRGSAEGGFTLFQTSYSYLRGNEVADNYQAGIFTWKDPTFAGTIGAPPVNDVFQYNYVSDTWTNGSFLSRGGTNDEISFNFFYGPAIASDGGIQIMRAATGVRVFGNTVVDLREGVRVEGDVRDIRFFQNRFINTPDKYSPAPAQVSWDASIFLGGNHWSGHPAAGNPSRGNTPFSGFIGGSYQDKFPYQSETLGQAYSVTIRQPVAGMKAAAGSQKTIAWKSTGCIYVDISYQSGAGSGVIASNFPDYGYYHWTVPAVAQRSDYTVSVACKNSQRTLTGVTGTSSQFSIGTADVVLLAPGPFLMSAGGSTYRAGWRKSGAVNTVNILVRVDGGAWTPAASNVGEAFVDFNMPAVNSNRVQVRVESTTNPNAADEVDGYFSVRSGGAFFTSALSGDILMGSLVELAWVSPSGSYYVDIDMWDPTAGSFFRVISDLPDYGLYTWLVPERYSNSAYLRLQFKNAARQALSTAQSGPFNLRYTTTAGTWSPLYRLYHPGIQTHLNTTDANEYNILGQNGWNQEGSVGQILNGPTLINGVSAIPFYRLYWATYTRHFWTTDRNEYFVLRETPGFNAEHIIGYVMPQQVPGTIPFFRLRHSVLPLHLWTTDAYEYSVLALNGWVQEGIIGYIQPVAPGQGSSFREAPRVISREGSPASAVDQSVRPGPQWLQTRDRRGERPPKLKAIAHAATFQTGPVAPGEIVSLFGTDLGPDENVSFPETSESLPLELGGVRVLLNGTAIPLLFVSAGELKAVLPEDIPAGEKLSVVVEYQGRQSDAVDVEVITAVPGVFTLDVTGKGQAAAVRENGSLNSADNAVDRGEVITLMVTGLGPTRRNPESARHVPVVPIEVLIGGIPVEVLDVDGGAQPRGLFQVRVRISRELPSGQAAVVVRSGDHSSRADATISIRND
jgi:uncharacterized protein (TIGR03437 family)